MGIFRRIWALGRRSKLDREIEDELREHLRMRAEVNIAKGMSPRVVSRFAPAMSGLRIAGGQPASPRAHPLRDVYLSAHP